MEAGHTEERVLRRPSSSISKFRRQGQKTRSGDETEARANKMQTTANRLQAGKTGLEEKRKRSKKMTTAVMLEKLAIKDGEPLEFDMDFFYNM